MRLVLQFLAVAATWFLASVATASVDGNPWLQLLVGVLVAAVAVLIYGWVVRRTERRPSFEVAPARAGRTLGLGTLLGLGIFGAVILSIALLGHYTVDGLGSPTAAAGLIGFMAVAATTEELLFRGVLFRLVERWTGTWTALVVTGLLFGGMHLLNPNATLWGAIAIAIEAGGMLTAAYVATRKLWLPIGLHFGWNVAASALFSTEVSGGNTPRGLLDATMSGPALITGGDFGPEGSILSVVLGIAVTAVFMTIAYRRGRVVPMARSARARVLEQVSLADVAGAAVTLPR